MNRLRRLYLRFYPTLVLYLITFCNRAAALETTAVDKAGVTPPPAALVESYQSLSLSVHDQVAALNAQYRFQSTHGEELELTCNLRLGARELVDSFAYWNGKEKVVGEVLEKETATAVYEQLAGVERRDPGILEQEGDHFRFRVFPVAPKENKPVQLTTVGTLPLREGEIEYVIPQENLPPAGASFAIHAQITDSLPIADVKTVGFAGRVTRISDRHVRVDYEAIAKAPTSDLKIVYRLAESDYSLRISTYRDAGGSGDGTFMLIVSPKAEVSSSDVIGRDLVFVTDISGSMAGAGIEQSKKGLLRIIEQLSPKDRFEVISFDDETYAMFGELRPASAEMRAEAALDVDALETKGGTNIHGALLHALTTLQTETPGRPRAIVFLTDGQGDAPPEVVLADVREKAGSVRIYSVGAGEGVNRPFLERLAEDNRGTATFVSDTQSLGDSMKSLYARIAMPLMVDLELDFAGLPVSSVYPKRLPDLYRDGEVIVLGRYKPGKGKLTLRGRTQQGGKSVSLDVTLPESEPEHAYLEKLWASRRIDNLLSTVALRGEAPELTQEVTRLGIVYNLVTPYTTFLAVPESVQTAEVKEAIRNGRMGYDKRLIDTLSGIELSQAAIPPGDPVLSVDAPRDAKQVIAYFPWGLVKELRYDDSRARWYVRFLAPRDLEDGMYKLSVRIEHKDGRIEWKDIDLKIDASEPELEVQVPEIVIPGERLLVRVDPKEPVRDVHISLRGHGKQRVKLVLDPETGLYVGEIDIPEDAPSTLELRVSARDLARNRVVQDVTLLVDLTGC